MDDCNQLAGAGGFRREIRFAEADVASGRGAVLFPAAEEVGETGYTVGVDIAEEMVRASTDEAARLGVHARLQVMDAAYLDFPGRLI